MKLVETDSIWLQDALKAFIKIVPNERASKMYDDFFNTFQELLKNQEDAEISTTIMKRNEEMNTELLRLHKLEELLDKRIKDLEDIQSTYTSKSDPYYQQIELEKNGLKNIKEGGIINKGNN